MPRERALRFAECDPGALEANDTERFLAIPCRQEEQVAPMPLDRPPSSAPAARSQVANVVDSQSVTAPGK